MHRPCAGLLLFLCLAVPAPAAAQVADSAAVSDTVIQLDSTVVTDSILRPRTAMIRSWLIPGWGQASIGSYFRGGLFVAAQGGSLYMMLKSWAKLAEARAIEEARRTWVSDSLRAIIFTDPDGEGAELMDPVVFQETVDADPRVESATDLVDSRSQQRQDWITALIFLTLLSGLDAYVSAHLADAPVSLETAVAPDGAIGLGLRVPVPGR